MASDDSHSINCALLDDDPERYPNLNANRMPPSAPIKTSNPWTPRNSFSNASLRRYRSFFRRDLHNNSLSNPSYTPHSSFALFRNFYLMRNSIKLKRPSLRRDANNNPIKSLNSVKFYSPPRLEIRHILVTIFITILSILFLIGMIILDLLYLNDAIPMTNSQQGRFPYQTLCLQYPKICAMKGLVILIFISVTGILCYSVLRLYIRARSHSRVLEQKTSELEKEKCLTEKLLHEILPPCVARDLVNGRKAPAESYDSVTVFFSDIVGFTTIASMCSPNETCDMLNQLYSIFDSLLENFDVYKVETIGDAYMVVSGAPNRNGDRHPNEIVNMALVLLCGKQHVRVPRTSAQIQLRIGIHTGPVCAAVIGSKMPRYCMFGDTVNVANRMESSGLPERIHLSDDTYQRLLNREQYIFEDRGEIVIKGKGLMRTYFLLGKKLTQLDSKSRQNLRFDCEQ